MKLRNLLALVLAVALLCTLPLTAFAAEAERPTLTVLMKEDTLIEDLETNAFTCNLIRLFGNNLLEFHGLFIFQDFIGNGNNLLGFYVARNGKTHV